MFSVNLYNNDQCVFTKKIIYEKVQCVFEKNVHHILGKSRPYWKKSSPYIAKGVQKRNV